MTREIRLSRGLVALVDDEDFERLNAFKWRASPNGPYSKTYYPVTGQRARMTMMHNMVLPPRDGFEVDHRDRNGLNNTRANLRYATRLQNMANRSYPVGASGYRGVAKRGNRFRAYIGFAGKLRTIGFFGSAREAAIAYDREAQRLNGEFASLNFSSDRDWLVPFPTAEAWPPGAGEDRRSWSGSGTVGAEKAGRMGRDG